MDNGETNEQMGMERRNRNHSTDDKRNILKPDNKQQRGKEKRKKKTWTSPGGNTRSPT